MILVLGTIRIPADKLDEVRLAMTKMITASRAEDGCEAYSYAFDALDDRLIHVIEKWRDRPALDRHFNAPHLAAWRNQFEPLGITDRDLTLYEIGSGEPT